MHILVKVMLLCIQLFGFTGLSKYWIEGQGEVQERAAGVQGKVDAKEKLGSYSQPQSLNAGEREMPRTD